MTDVNTRGIILDCLSEILERGAYSHLVLQQVLEKYAYLEKQQRSFITRVVQGTLERRIELDAVLDQFSKTPVKKMKPLIRNILRSGVYQILYLDGVPDAAVCDEAVKLAKKRGFYQLSGFVNGVLRSVCRNREKIVFSDPSVRYSMPQWILDLWRQTYDEKTVVGMLEAFLTPAPTTVRVNTERIAPEELKARLEEKGVSVMICPDLSYALNIDGYDRLAGMEEFREGLFYVQDLSSMLAVEAAGIAPGDTVIDVCGAPGGKSLDAAMLLRGSGSVECRDISDRKVALIAENIRRCGLDGVQAVKKDALVRDEASAESADVVLADLPCSGLGIIGKKPDIKYHMTPEKLRDLADLQLRMLDVVCAYVRPGGTLLYSTCTVNPGENQENVERFLEKHSEFSCESMEQLLPVSGKQDGFFYAALRREEMTSPGRSCRNSGAR